jgi:hypothetical protein
MNLKKEHVNKLLNLEDCSVLHVEQDEFSSGDVLHLFNNSEQFATIESSITNTYRTGFPKACKFIEFPPRSLMSAVFVNKDTVVFSRGV